MKKRGRPLVGGGKNIKIQVRLSAEDAARIGYVREKTGKTTSEIVREGIRMQYNLAQFK